MFLCVTDRGAEHRECHPAAGLNGLDGKLDGKREKGRNGFNPAAIQLLADLKQDALSQIKPAGDAQEGALQPDVLTNVRLVIDRLEDQLAEGCRRVVRRSPRTLRLLH